MHWTVPVVAFLRWGTMSCETLQLQCLTDVCHGVGTEPCLQPLSDKPLHHSTANREDGAHLDIVAIDFGEAVDNVHLLCEGVQPICAESQQVHPSPMLQKEWTEEEEGIQWEGQGSWTWILFPMFFFHLGRYGTNRHRCVLTSCLNDCWETRGTIQSNPLSAEMQAKLLAVALSNSMPVWGSFIARTTSTMWCDRPDLRWRSSPSILTLTLSLISFHELMCIS